ncbi:hypothetical protein [Anaerosalibacter bizertensis]|nr:hypothetical protein [Anaerosalibacter bizertensis]
MGFKNKDNDDYLLFFFLILTWIWDADYNKNSLLFFFLLLAFSAA